MNPHKNVPSHFAVCVNNSRYPASLALYKIYRVLPDEDATRNGELRVLDESGEDYLYPADHFMPIEVPSAVEQAISKSPLVIQKTEEASVLDLLVSQAEDLGPKDLSMNVDYYLYGLPKRGD